MSGVDEPNPFRGVNAEAMQIIGLLLGKVYQQADEWERPTCDEWLALWRDARGDDAKTPWRWWIGEVGGESYALDFPTRAAAIAGAARAIRRGDVKSDDGRYQIVEARCWADDVTACDEILWFVDQRHRAILSVPRERPTEDAPS